ncbi:hypothetical protein EVA_09781 [gut metagenome]|uniref:Uncharacterized protein n=1 Tax=gut metagenome TaxID=749906 RepID=J9GQ35_9ZZZZ
MKICRSVAWLRSVANVCLTSWIVSLLSLSRAFVTSVVSPVVLLTAAATTTSA